MTYQVMKVCLLKKKKVMKVCFQITSRLFNKKKYIPNKIWTKTAQRGSRVS